MMKDASEVRLDRHGDPLPEGALSRLGTARFRHGLGTSVIAASPDGLRLASGDRFGTVMMWEVPTGRRLWRTELLGRITDLVFSPDGLLLASGGHEAVELQEVATGRRVRSFRERFTLSRRFPGAEGSDDVEERACESGFIAIYGVAFSPDGRALAAADFTGVACVWDLDTGERRLTLRGERLGDVPLREEESFCSIAYSPDGALLAVGSWYEVGTVTDGGVSIEGKQGRVLIWEVTSGRRLLVLDRPGGIPWRLAFSRDGGTIVSFDDRRGDGMAFAWDMATGRELWGASSKGGELPHVLVALPNEPPMPADRRFRLADGDSVVLPDGQRYAYDAGLWDNGLILVRSLATGEDLGPRPRILGWVIALAFSPDGSVLATAVPEEEILLWDVAGGQILNRLGYRQEYPRNSCALAFGPRRLAVASQDDGAEGGRRLGVRILEWETGRRVREVCDVPAQALAWLAGDDVLAIGTRPGDIRLVEVATGRPLSPPFRHEKPVLCLAVSPDGSALASGDLDGSVCLWDWKSGRRLRSFAASGSAVVSMAYSGDRTLIVADRDGRASLWDGDTGAMLLSFHSEEPPQGFGHGRECGVACSPSGAALFAVSSQVDSKDEFGHEREQFRTRVWDVTTGSEVLRTPPSPEPFAPLAFRPDARVLASVSEGVTVLLWDIEAIGPSVPSPAPPAGRG